jgi:hypothetical protein
MERNRPGEFTIRTTSGPTPFLYRSNFADLKRILESS